MMSLQLSLIATIALMCATVTATVEEVMIIFGNPLSSGSDDTSMDQPRGIWVSPTGDAFVCEPKNHWIRKITRTGQVSIFAGSGAHRRFTAGRGRAAELPFPDQITGDSAGNMYVTHYWHPTINMISKITPEGDVSELFSNDAGEFTKPRGIAVRSDDSIFVADDGNNRIRKIAPDGSVSTVYQYYQDQPCPKTDISRCGPRTLAFDSSDNLFVARREDSVLHLFVGGSGTPQEFTDLAPGVPAYDHVGSIYAMAFDAQDNLLVAAYHKNQIWLVKRGGQAEHYAFSGARNAVSEGSIMEAALPQPSGVGIDLVTGQVYVASNQGHIIMTFMGEPGTGGFGPVMDARCSVAAPPEPF